MAEALLEQPDMIVETMPNMSHIITEDDEPVDNVFSEKQQRLLVEPLYSSWQSERPFFAAANVGVFYAIHQPPLVPDMFLSLDVQPDEDIWRKENRSYFLWKFGKPPEVVIEVVSNKKGGETERKFRLYARMGVWYYVIFDPEQLVLDAVLQVYGLSIARYLPKPDLALTEVNLKLTLWEGTFEGLHTQWLRWCDAEGNLLLTGSEQAAHEHQRAEQERQRAERLAEQLRALGVEPENGKKS
jgi:Uma2 family endonuclease